PQQAAANRRAALLQDLLRGLAELTSATTPNTANPPNVANTFEQRARVLAEEALRIDAASKSLREVATQLQHAADALGALQRQRAIAVSSAAGRGEARRLFATAPLPSPSIDSALAGALSDVAPRPR